MDLVGGGGTVPPKSVSHPETTLDKHCLTLQRWYIFAETLETKGFFQFDTITNVSVSSFRQQTSDSDV